MKLEIKDPIIFTAGLVIGGITAWLISKKYYSDLADEEINSVRRSFAKLQEDAQRRADAAKSKPDIGVVVDALNKAREQEKEKQDEEKNSETPHVNYTGFSGDVKEDEEIEDDEEEDSYFAGSTAQPVDKKVDHRKPYLLNRMPYPNERPYHSLITVMYYADGTYADPRGMVMEIEDYIGLEMMNHVEESEEDELFIRNDALELDVDIVKDARTYEEVMFG